MAFIFGGNTGMSYEEMMRQRDLASQLAAQVGQGGYTALGAGLASGILARRSDKAQKKGREEAQGRAQSVLGQLFGQQVMGQPMGGQPMQGGGMAAQLDPMDPTAIAGDTMAALGKDGGTAGYRQSLIGTESGGNWKAQNAEMGAGGQAGHFGRVQFGKARLQEAMDAGAIPQGVTPEQFMNSPALQVAAENWHFGDLENKLGDLVGREVNGQQLDMGALVAMGHLGGAGGARKYVESGGRYNPADSFGTSLAEYAQTHGGTQTTMSAQNAPPQPDMAALTAAMSDPYLDDGTRSVLGQMFQQQMQRQDPAYQMGMQTNQLALEKAQLELDQMRNPQAKPGYRTLSPQEAQQMGLPEGGVYQVSPEGQIDVVREPVAPEAPKMTSDMQEYEFARSQGYEGTFQQYQTDMKRAGATSVNVTPGGEPSDGPLRKKLSEKEGEAWAAYMDSGTVSSGTMQDMQLLDELITMAPQGPISGRIAGAFPGVNSAADAFTSVVKRVAPTLRAPGSGATSDIEYDGMLKSLPQLSSRPEANAAISGMMKAKAQINIERGQIVSQYQNGEISAADARQAINDLNSRSILTPELESLFGAMGGGAQMNDAPEGVDPDVWEVMTEEERALFQ